MSINPILEASSAIQVHVLTASIALILGPFVLSQERRGKLHKTLGYIWITAMAITALSSFFIHGFKFIWVFSPIHFLSAYVLYGLCRALWYIRNGNVVGHSQTMRGLYWYGVLAAGAFTFIPGRIMNRTIFPDAPWLGFVVIECGAVFVVRQIRRDARGFAG